MVADAAADAVAAASALADDAELAEVVALLDAVGAVYRAVDDLTVAPPGADPGDFLPVIARELFEYLLADHLAKKAPGFLWALHGLGVIDFEPVAPAGGRPGFVRTRFAWELLPEALSDPGAIPAELFGWGTPDFDFARVAEIGERAAGRDRRVGLGGPREPRSHRGDSGAVDGRSRRARSSSASPSCSSTARSTTSRSASP